MCRLPLRRLVQDAAAIVDLIGRPAVTLITLPSRAAVRDAIGPSVARWARAHGWPPPEVHKTIHRYSGRTVDANRIWGRRTHAMLCALDAAVRSAEAERWAAPS